MISRNDACWCGSQKKWKKCHYPKEDPSSSTSSLRERYRKQYQILIKTEEQIAGIRKACAFTADLLRKCCERAKVGVTTNEIDQFAVDHCKKHGVVLPCLGYGSPPFPKTICTSLNDVICHGIPDDLPLQEGDIVNIDISCLVDGYYGDCSAMVMVGKVSYEKEHVVKVSKECLMRSIAIVKPGLLISEIGTVIEDYATSEGCSVVDQFVGHGVGLHLHEAPQVPHHYNQIGIPLMEGMTFTIEPMINAGLRDAIIDERDGWTARTIDGKPSAQFEHTLLVTESGCEILTL